MKTLSVLLSLLTVSSSHATPWEDFLNLPAPQNAAATRSIDYTEPVQGGYLSGDLDILQTQVLAGDANAFQLAFRLYEKADGGLAEELGVILSKTIRTNPSFFLRQIALIDPSCKRFQWILNTPGLEYVDRPKAAKYEVEMRKKALSSVTGKAPVLLARRCRNLITWP